MGKQDRHHKEPHGSGTPQGAMWVRDTTGSHVGQGCHREPRGSGTPQGATLVRDTTGSHVGQGHHKEPRGSGTPQGATWVRDTTRSSHVGQGHHKEPRGSGTPQGAMYTTRGHVGQPGQMSSGGDSFSGPYIHRPGLARYTAATHTTGHPVPQPAIIIS